MTSNTDPPKHGVNSGPREGLVVPVSRSQVFSVIEEIKMICKRKNINHHLRY